MPKKTNKTTNRTNFDLTTNSKEYETILIKFKICISQLITKILLKQRSLNQIRHYLRGHFQA